MNVYLTCSCTQDRKVSVEVPYVKSVSHDLDPRVTKPDRTSCNEIVVSAGSFK